MANKAVLVTGISRLTFANALSTALSLLPAADLVGTSELGISDMRAWCTAKADEHHRHALTFNAILNILAPIHGLPPEILSRILIEAWHERKSLRLTHVCRLWRTILLDTSEFWAVAIAGDKFRLLSDATGKVSDEDYFDSAFLRSAPRNISLRLLSMSSRGNFKLIQYTDRITSMEVTTFTDDQLDLLWEMLHAGMPRLENLVIHGDILMSETNSAEFSTETLPVLARLTLPAQATRASWPRTLRELTIRDRPEYVAGNFWYLRRFRVKDREVLKELRYYPMLTMLDIRDDMLVHDALFNDPLFQLSSLAFPALQLLRIESRLEIVSAIISLITFPPSTHVKIQVAFWPTPREGDLFVPGSALDGVAARVDQVAIENGLLTTVHGYTDGAENLRVRVISDGRNPPQIERILRLFTRTNAPVSHIYLTLHWDTPLENVLFMCHKIFPAFPHLAHLVLRGRNVACTELLAALCPPSESESVTPLPLLKELTVGITTKYRSKIDKDLKRIIVDVARLRDDGEVFTRFRECCSLFPGVLDVRARQGNRLSHLEFFVCEDRCTNKRQILRHVDLAALACNSVERELEPLRRLVDGPVVFSGYRFFTSA